MAPHAPPAAARHGERVLAGALRSRRPSGRWPGSVPGQERLGDHVVAAAAGEPARWSASTRTRLSPGGVRNGVAGWSFSAVLHDLDPDRQGQRWRRSRACPAAAAGRSRRTRATTRSGEKPTNQASLLSLVVPVLPASGLPIVQRGLGGAALDHALEHETIW